MDKVCKVSVIIGSTIMITPALSDNSGSDYAKAYGSLTFLKEESFHQDQVTSIGTNVGGSFDAR